jgi:uncharacterized protein YqgC (DUF456 family)
MDVSSLLWLAVALMVAVGVVGVVVPVLPGIVLVLAGLALGAWIDDFAYAGRGTLLVLAGLTALGMAIDFAASALGAQRVGAHRRAVIGAALGALVGVCFALPGILLGPFVGAAIGEFSARGSLGGAGRVGLATWLGMALGGAAKLAIALSMIALFAYRRLA